MLEEGSKRAGNGGHNVSVANGREDVFPQVLGKMRGALSLAARTKIPRAAGKSYQVLQLTGRAHDYRCLDSRDLQRDALIGISAGGGTVDPGRTDFLAALPLSSGTRPTIYELDSAVGGFVLFDLEQTNIVFEPKS